MGMWSLRVRVATPACSWCRGASLGSPGVGLRVTSFSLLPGGRCVEVVEMSGEGWREALARLKAEPAVHEVEVLEAGPRQGKLRLTVPACALARAVEANGVPPMLPFTIERGADEWLLVCTQDRARAFLEELRREGVAVELVASAPYSPPRGLTERQQEILDAAVREGYYDYPRRINLTMLADKLGITKSTLSESLMIVEREMLGHGGLRGRERERQALPSRGNGSTPRGALPQGGASEPAGQQEA